MPEKRLISVRQGQILALVAQGLSDKEIALHLSLSPSTVKTYLSRLYRYHRLKNRAQAVGFFTERTLGDRLFELQVRSYATAPLDPPLSTNSVTAEIRPVQTPQALRASAQEVTDAKTTVGDLRSAGVGRIVSA